MKKTLFVCALAIFTVCVVPIEKSLAAGAPPPPQNCWPPPCIPIDGGISLLIAAGVALGGKKMYDFRKK